MRIETSVGHKGAFTVCIDNDAYAALTSHFRGGPDRDLRVRSHIDANGVLRITDPKRPGPGLVRRVIKKRSARENTQWTWSAGYLKDDHGLKDPIPGGPWRLAVSDGWRWQGAEEDMLEVDPPHESDRVVPVIREASTTRSKAKRKNQHLLFLGTAPDGSEMSFTLPLTRALELHKWLDERDVDVIYED